MKQTVRRGVFETNSSSTHSLSMCEDSDYKKWISGEYVYDYNRGELISLSERENRLEELRVRYREYIEDEKRIQEYVDDAINDRFLTYEEFFDDDYYETYHTEYTTKSGEKIHAFGKYGYS